MIISMITMIGNSVYSATSTDDLPAAIMMLMTSIYFFLPLAELFVRVIIIPWGRK